MCHLQTAAFQPSHTQVGLSLSQSLIVSFCWRSAVAIANRF
ncbi:hypothetical protein [Chlorogloeopsis sp. ULAP02]